MKRRQFVVTASTLAGVACTPGLALAQAKAPQAGVDFVRVDPPAAVDAPPGKVEVLEFFWYNCPHCHAFEPGLSAWTKTLPKDVVFKRVPIAFDDSFVPQQRLFYALEALKLVDKLHAKVFQAIHVEHLKLGNAQAITEWVVKQGVDRAKFTEQFNSFSVSTLATRARQLQNAYRIEGVPALGVAGRFVTDGAMTKSMERALQVANFLIAEVRAKRT